MASREALIPAYRPDLGSRMIEEAIACRSLWAAVLWLAVYDLSGSRRRSLLKAANRVGYEQRAAHRYLLSDDESVGSARWICSQLDIDFRAFQMRCLTAEGRARILKRVGDLAVTPEMDE